MLRLMMLLLAAWLALPQCALAVSEEDLLPIDEAFAVSVTAPERGRIEVHWQIAEGYYLYRHRMGVTPTGSGFKFNPLELPDGKQYTDEFFGEVETYRNKVTAVLTGAAADGVDELELRIRYQGCADLGVCYPPHSKTLTVKLPAQSGKVTSTTQDAPNLLTNTPPAGLQLPGMGHASPAGGLIDTGAALPEDQAFQFEAIVQSPTVLLVRFTPAKGYYLYRDRSAFRVVDGEGLRVGQPAWPPAASHFDDHFGDVLVYFDQVEVPLPLMRTQGAVQPMTLEATFQGCQTDGICYAPMTRQVSVTLPAAPVDLLHVELPGDDLGTPGFWAAILFALAGGLILNLMPCVLPVLSLKVLGLAGSGESEAKARAHALWYTAGVLVSFAAVGLIALALREAGLALGWGFQLQQPVVVAGLGMLMFALGLSLSGVFSVGGGMAGLGQTLTQKSGASGDFFTGVLAVVVATPCTAPFMGGALAFAFTAPPALAVTVFLALGLGLALPFLLVGFVPALARLLPRPGAWMDTFKQVLAFPMYLTAVWLIWVLGRQRGVDAVGLILIGMTVVGAGLWWWGRLGLDRRPLQRLSAIVLVALGLGIAASVGSVAQPARSDVIAIEGGSIAYDAAKLDALRADGKVVFVNMTADWCVTCKANEKAVLAQDRFRQVLEETDAVYMKGDWTNVDPDITRFLESHGAYGVPLYVVYAGNEAGRKLPAVLTADLVEQALRDAAH